MKGQVMPLYQQLATEELNELTTETKETVAKQHSGNEKKFGSIDLWNHRRQTRQAGGFQRRWQMS